MTERSAGSAFHRAARLAAAVLVVLALLAPLGDARSQPATSEAATRIYDVVFEARVSPTERSAHVQIQLGSGAHLVRELRFSIDPVRHAGFEGDGSIEASESTVVWTPPPEGGSLRYVFRIDHLRDERSYDSRCAATWALLRGDDLFPAARVRFKKGARSRSRLRLRLPEGWSAAVPHVRLRGGDYAVNNPTRDFDRPTGWMVFGELGVVRESVGGTRVAIAGPVRHRFRRLDILALLRWTLPELGRILGAPIDRLLVVGANDPMWRGGLSAPGSAFVHADLPLISEDGSSPLLHELVHTALGARGDDEVDWIVEGLAEYYSLVLLGRSGTLSESRLTSAFDKAAERAASTRNPNSRVRTTAEGASYFRRLDASVRNRSGGQKSLDDLVRVLASRREAITADRFADAFKVATGFDLAEFEPSP